MEKNLKHKMLLLRKETLSPPKHAYSQSNLYRDVIKCGQNFLKSPILLYRVEFLEKIAKFPEIWKFPETSHLWKDLSLKDGGTHVYFHTLNL